MNLSRIREVIEHGHEDCCASLHDFVIEGEVGTGPWDTAMKAAPCNCRVKEVLSDLDNMEVSPMLWEDSFRGCLDNLANNEDWTADGMRLYAQDMLTELDRVKIERKVVTEEEVIKEAVRRYGPALYKPGDFRHDCENAVVFLHCYEWLRSKGYLNK